VFLFVRLLGYDFLNASASAKLLNVSTNIAALILFTAKGHVWWHFALPLAVANVVGSCLAHTWPSSTARGLCAGSSSWWSVH
jgi:uncharacterized membrane protein YfcA